MVVLVEQVSAVTTARPPSLSSSDYGNVVSGAFAEKILEEALKYRSYSPKYRKITSLRQSESAGALPVSAKGDIDSSSTHGTAGKSFGINYDITSHAATVDPHMFARPRAAVDITSHSATVDHYMFAVSEFDVDITSHSATVDRYMFSGAAGLGSSAVFKVMTSVGFKELVGKDSLAEYLANR
eukprot:scaffold57148_cov33-Tisochrysis_lutea.AAC.1